jgi:dipeptidyl aminopeptidase/acylaminoacyl peptidase
VTAITQPGRKPRYLTWIVLALLPFSDPASAQDDGKVLFLSEYLTGDYFYADLGDVDVDRPAMIRPRKMRLPGRFRAQVQLGNHDVSYDGSRIAFAARDTRTGDWDIYLGAIDTGRGRIGNIVKLTHRPASRDEDPRFSWTGEQIVYKCNNDICIYPDGLYPYPVVASDCELWAPSFDSSGYAISYGERCGSPDNDRIRYFDLVTRRGGDVPGSDGAPDRFAYFLEDGSIVYSHSEPVSNRTSLWLYTLGPTVALLHDRTESDDDPYPDKHDSNHIAFIGWQNGGYDLFVYRQDRRDSVQLSRSTRMLAPVLFR